MTRVIETSRRKIEDIAATSENFGRIIRATLAEDYDGVGKTVRIRMGRTESAQTIQAKVSSLTALTSSYPEGSPVALKFRRGRAEVTAFGSVELTTVRTIVEKTGVSDAFSSGLSSPSVVVFSAAQVVVDTHLAFSDTDDSITIPFDGYYHVWAYNQWASDALTRRLYIYLNGSQKWLINTTAPVAAVQALNFAVTYPFEQDDVIQLYASQNSGNSVNLTDAMLGVELVK